MPRPSPGERRRHESPRAPSPSGSGHDDSHSRKRGREDDEYDNARRKSRRYSSPSPPRKIRSRSSPSSRRHGRVAYNSDFSENEAVKYSKTKNHPRKKRRSLSRSSEEERHRRRRRDEGRQRRRHSENNYNSDDDGGGRRRRHQRHRPHSRSPNGAPSRRKSPSPPLRSSKPLDSQDAIYDMIAPGRRSPAADRPPPKEKPNFNQTGLLARETNLVRGTNIVLKYNEPPEARKPPASQPWRLYVFKDSDVLDTIELWERSVWLLGREERVVDVVTLHPSCSGQHAALQFRYTTKREKGKEDWELEGKTKGRVRLYLIDLESANGTSLNGERVEGGRYFELRNGDLIKFGGSEREYVVMLPPRTEPT